VGERRWLDSLAAPAGWLASGALAASFACILFLSSYLNYGAEGAAVAGLARFSTGAALYSEPPDLPLTLNQYSPYFYWLLGPFARLAGGADPTAGAFAGRLLMLGFACACAGVAVSLARGYFGTALRTRDAALALLAAFISFPANLLAVKPDLPSLLLELLALKLALEAVEGERDRGIPALASGALAAGAAALKLNSVGVLLGAALFFSVSGRWRAALAFSGAAAAALSGLAALAWVAAGPGILSNMGASLANEVSTDPRWVAQTYLGLGWKFLLPQAFLLALAWRGLAWVMASSPARARLLAACLAVSFGAAFAAQLKFGAFTNYFYGFLAIAASLAAGEAGRGGGSRALVRAGFLAVLAIQAVLALRVPAVILRDRARGAPDYAGLRRHLDERAPGGRVYSRDPGVLTYFQERAVFGPETELILEHSPGLSRWIPEIARGLPRAGVAASIAAGPDCERWRPSSHFGGYLDRFRVLSARLGDLCVFVPEPAAPVEEGQ